MAKKARNSGVYRVTEVIGTSAISWEDAAKTAVETAAQTLRDLAADWRAPNARARPQESP